MIRLTDLRKMRSEVTVAQTAFDETGSGHEWDALNALEDAYSEACDDAGRCLRCLKLSPYTAWCEACGAG